jgi:hypothetical protein
MSTIVRPGLLDPARPYADWHFYDGYGCWNLRGGRLVCFLRGHHWKWVVQPNTEGWHLQCIRCRRIEHNPLGLHLDETERPYPPHG